ncbi:MAG: type VI secretion system tube protein TssD [Bacteroidales bacterium]
MEIKMIVHGVERKLFNLSYDYFKPPKLDVEKSFDQQERPSLRPSYYPIIDQIGGLFNVCFESKDATEDDFFVEWLAEGWLFDGCFEIYPKRTQDQSPIRIEFWDCCVVNYQEAFNSGGSPMTMNLRLSPAITKNRGFLQEKPWKFTDLSEGGEYARDEGVEEDSFVEVYLESENGERINEITQEQNAFIVISTQGKIGAIIETILRYKIKQS